MGASASAGVMQDIFDVKEKLGVGTFGTVKRAINKKTKEEVAIKIIKKKKITSKTKKLIEREVGITMALSHSGIVRTLDCYESEKYVYLVLELCRGGEVFERVAAEGKFSEKLASKVIKQIVEAVAYLHGKGIIHRDLKPENLLYVGMTNDSVVKITDFGFARRIDGPAATMETTCGTLNYVAPEVLGGKPYGKECDNWSIGVITYVLLAGYLPFYGVDKQNTFMSIVKGSYDFDDESWDEVSKYGKDFIKKLLTVDPKKRMSLKDALKHDWIANPEKCTDTDFGDIFKKKLGKTARAEKGDTVDLLKQTPASQPDLYGDDEEETKDDGGDDKAKKVAFAPAKEDAPEKEAAPDKKAADAGMKTVATGKV